MGFKIKKTVNGETVWEPVKAKKYTASKTIEYTGTLPITITADGNALLDYRVYGNTEQTGTPTPENPIMPIGCGERTENLWDIHELHESYNFVTIEDATVFIPNAQGMSALYFTGVDVSIPAPFTISFNGVQIDNPATNARVRLVFDDDTAAEMNITDLNGVTIESNSRTFTKNLKAIRFNWLTPNSGISFKNFMIDSGLTALPYEPYGYKLPMTVSDGNTVQTVPVYLGEVETTRRIKKVVLTGEETSYMAIDESKNIFSIRGVFNQSPELLQVGGFCTHYKYNNAISSLAQNMSNGDFILNKIVNDYSFTIRDNSFSNDTNFKQYVRQQYAAGTPVTVWYVLAEPETGIVNEPLMKIGEYADTLSMEQADASIPTFAGTTVIDYDGTLKPSQMYIKYNSWSGWEDIDNYKMVNGNWTQEVT